jgi:VWFA-related protein
MIRLRPSGFGTTSPFRVRLRTWVVGFAASLVCFGATGPLAQQPQTPPAAPQDPPMPTPLFRAVANVVRVDALVTERGKPVTKLTADDFELSDSGVVQQVTAVNIEDVEIDVILALDTSGSVAGGRLQALRDAASALVRNLRPEDRAAVVTFASGVTVNAPLTTDHTAVARALETAEARGATSLVDAAWTSVLLAHGNDRPTLVLVFSDGVDTSSWLRVDPVLALTSRANLVVDAVVAGGGRLLGSAPPGRTAARTPVPTGAALDAATATPRDAGVEDFLLGLTASTGGRIVDGSAGSRLEAAFVAALREFRTRYQLSYTPTGVDRPGWHPIDVRVKRPGATIRARPGYTQ